MTKKIVMSVAALAVAIVPMLTAVRADSGGLEQIQATEAWNYTDHKVEKLSFETNAIGPVSIGDSVVVAEPTDACVSGTCDRYDLSVLKDGMKMFIGNVPASTLSEQRYLNAGSTVMYMDASDLNQNHWNVVTTDLSTGEETDAVQDLFLDGVETIDVQEDNGIYYINPTFNFNNHTGFSNGTIYSYDPSTDLLRTVSDHYQMNQEQLQDVQDGKVLSIMAFSSGNSQLWVYDTNTGTDNYSLSAVPGTWTPSNEQIVGAHFLANGDIEYFMAYQRYVYDGTTSVAQGDYLSWYRSTDDALQVVNGRMAWLDASDTLRVSDENGVVNLGTIGYPTEFRLTDDALFYATGTGVGMKYDFATKTSTTLPFVVTDTLGDILVGVDGSSTVMYLNQDTGRSFEIGSGTDPVISDDSHVYWSGTDGGIYEGTLTLSALAGEAEPFAVQVSGSPLVYLVEGDTAYTIPNESVYFSWFNSWTDVKTVASVASYTDGGAATYKPGTEIKLSGDPKVYVVGTDGKLHWLTTQTIAYTVVGPAWNQNIVTLSGGDFYTLPLGLEIMTESDAQNI